MNTEINARPYGVAPPEFTLPDATPGPAPAAGHARLLAWELIVPSHDDVLSGARSLRGFRIQALVRLPSYGQPALVKLLNNAPGTYNLAATARMLNPAAQLGIPAERFFEQIAVSTGQSWMSNTFIDLQYDLLLEDAALLRGEIGSLPAVDIEDDVEQSILQARALLRSHSANE